MILELQRTDGVRHALNRILDRMCKVVHRVNTPLVTGIVMVNPCHTINDRITHVHIRRSHINLCAKHLRPVLIHAVLHILEQLQILLDRTVAVRALLTRLRQCAAILPDLIRRKITDKRLSFLDQLDRCLIHLVEIVGRKEQPILKICTKPLYIRDDGLYEL